MITVTLYNSSKGETQRLHQLCVFVCIAFAGIWSHQAFAQTPVCGPLMFHSADHIRNGSLEQYSGYCYNSFTRKSGDSINPGMSTVIWYWNLPVQNYLTATFFGKCNNFYQPAPDASFYAANPSAGPLYLPLVPLPIPDGQGLLGFEYMRTINGSPSTDSFYYKDYFSNNLFRSLKKDSTYRLDFNIGFGLKDTIGIPYNKKIAYLTSTAPVKMELFGLADSTHLPFNKPPGFHPGYGCLSQINPEWIPLGSVIVYGTPGNWVQSAITFTAPVNMQTLAIGPACDFSDVPFTPLSGGGGVFYYFLDNLQFYQASSPKPKVEVSGGSYCAGTGAFLTLHLKSADYYRGSQLQWYKNGQILAGDTSSSLVTTPATYGPGWYQCGIKNDSLCVHSDSLQVFWDPDLSSFPGLGADTTACNADTITLTVHGGMSASYRWSTGDNDSTIRITQAGAYSIDAVNACSSVHATKNISFKECPPELWVPSAFSPNRDGRNDVFRAHARGQIQNFRLRIFNRYGQLIFQTSDISQGWDGNLHSIQQGTGAYIWMAGYSDSSGKEYKQQGTVVLIR